MSRWPTSKARLDSAWAAQWEDCVGSAGCDRQRFPRLQDRVCSYRSRSSYDPVGIHLEILLILKFVVWQSSAKLEDQSQSYERRKCRHPSAKDKAQMFHPEQAILSKTMIYMRGRDLTCCLGCQSSPALGFLVAMDPGKENLDL
jgi:hypothetical protein